MTTDQILAQIVDGREGGVFTNDPVDHGGPTKWGVTQDTLSDYLGRPATIDEVRELTRERALAILKVKFVNAPGFAAVGDEKLREILIDSSVQHHPRVAVKLLQRALGLSDDGVLGPKTRAALNASSPGQLWLLVYAERTRLYGRIIRNDSKQARFAAGWANRMADLLVDFAAG